MRASSVFPMAVIAICGLSLCCCGSCGVGGTFALMLEDPVAESQGGAVRNGFPSLIMFLLIMNMWLCIGLPATMRLGRRKRRRSPKSPAPPVDGAS